MATATLGAELPTENDYYPITTFQIPENVVLEACGFQMMPDGKLAVCSRRGEIWMISNPFSTPVEPSQFSLFASGLHECLSLAEKDGWLYVVQRGELSRLKDVDGDGRADIFETVNDGWEINGDYHEYAFGSKFDSNGDIWVSLCLTMSFSSDVLYRGWALRVTPEGELIPTVSGVRSPGGMGVNAEGVMFMTDNQGPWNGTNSLKVMKPGEFAGNPEGLKWFSSAEKYMGRPPALPVSGSRFVVEADRIPEMSPPCILFPYKKMGQSATGIACDITQGKFGPFQNQLFVGDQMFSSVMRVDLEKVGDDYQGACFPFREGLASGTVGVEMSPQGAMFTGGTSRGWGSRGPKEFCIERIDWSGKVPFEILTMRLLPNGFRLQLTQPVDSQTAKDVSSYRMETYTYLYQEAYGSPETEPTKPVIEKAIVSEDGLSIDLIVNGLQRGHVHELHAQGLRSSKGLPLLHSNAYYTLNNFVK